MNRIQRVAISYLVVILVLVWGYAIGRYEVFPYRFVESQIDELVSFYEGSPEVEQTLMKKVTDLAAEKTFGTPVQHLAEEYGSPHLTLESGIKIKPDELLQLTSWWDDALHVRLLDHEGNIFKKWKIDEERLKNALSHKIDPLRTGLQGAQALFDGSVLFTYGTHGLVKLDKCGVIQWVLPKAHHLISLTARGTYWVPKLEKKNEDYMAIEGPYDDALLIEIDSSGTILNNISFTELLIENNLQALLFSNGQPNVSNVHPDIAHVNEIEELHSNIAHRFPMFSSGDLMVSARNLNLILIFDPETKKVKWYQAGPFLRQHDPDFQPDGTITVFNNNNDRSNGELFGGSNILQIQPETHRSHIKYKAVDFFTRIAGTHQVLEDGRMLIVESTRGRVFMVDNSGKLVFEYVERVDGDIVQQPKAEIYKKKYFTEDIVCYSN